MALCLLVPSGAVADGKSESGLPPRLQKLLHALEDESYKLRLQAAVFLGRLDDLRAVDALLAHLRDDPHYTVRAACALALANLEEPRAVPHLLQRSALDPEIFVRHEAANALRKYDRELILVYVVEAFSSGSDAVRLEALRYLSDGPLDAVEFVLQEALGDKGDVRLLALAVVQRVAEGDRLRFLRQALASRRPSVRTGAIEALRAVKDDAAAELVREIFNRDVEVDEVRQAARLALKSLRPYVDMQGIIDVATGKHGAAKHDRARAIKSLGVLGGDEAKHALLTTLHDPEHYLRGTTVIALRELGDAGVVPELEAMAGDPANDRIKEHVDTAIRFLRRGSNASPRSTRQEVAEQE